MMRGLTLIALFMLPLLAGAETVYRWTDSAGVVHFGQNPPDQGAYTRMQTDTSTGSAAPKSGAQNFLRQSEATDAASTRAHDADTTAKAERAEQCAKARENLATLTDAPPHRFMVTGADGQPSRMTDDQFQQRLDAAKKQEAQACS